jgi:hypothetical protein
MSSGRRAVVFRIRASQAKVAVGLLAAGTIAVAAGWLLATGSGSPGPKAGAPRAAPARPAYSMHGQVITYTYVVSNAGNVTLRNVALDDTVFGRISRPKTTLAAGTSMTCHATHAISGVDLNEGSILNFATAIGHPPTGGPVESPSAHALVTAVKVAPLPEVPVTG